MKRRRVSSRPKFPVIRHTIMITGAEDLGSRASMVTRLARRTIQMRKRIQAEVVRPARVPSLRRELLRCVNYRPEPVPFRARLLGEENFSSYRRRFYRLQINPDDETEAVLYLPHHASARNPVPALLGVHEHGGQLLLGKDKLCHLPDLPGVFRNYQKLCYGGQPPADFFASQGFAVLSIDQISFGSRAIWRRADRGLLTGERPLSARHELQLCLRMRYEHLWLHRALMTCGYTEAEICLYDNRRSLDFMATLPEIDSKRIGAFGLSVGSMHCHQLAAFDPRVRASVRVCWAGDLPTMLAANGPRAMSIHFLLPGISPAARCPSWWPFRTRPPR